MKSWCVALGFAGSLGLVACGGGGSREVPTSPGSATVSAPTPQSPINDQQLDTLRPTLVVQNASSSGSGAITYDFDISDNQNFTSTAVSQTGIAEGSGTTSFTPASDLPASTRMYWRARARQGAAVDAGTVAAQRRAQRERGGGCHQLRDAGVGPAHARV